VVCLQGFSSRTEVSVLSLVDQRGENELEAEVAEAVPEYGESPTEHSFARVRATFGLSKGRMTHTPALTAGHHPRAWAARGGLASVPPFG
jgi:hypothetical protein